jgi:hypothetical protein
MMHDDMVTRTAANSDGASMAANDSGSTGGAEAANAVVKVASGANGSSANGSASSTGSTAPAAPAVKQRRGGRQRAVLNESGVPQCLEKLLGPAAAGAGGGDRGGAGDGSDDGEAAAGGAADLITRFLPTNGARSASEAEWDKLVGKIDLSKTCSTLQSVTWVFDNAGVEPSRIDPTSVPSKGSLRMLKWVQTSDSNYNEFIRSIWSKTIPSKTEIERAGRFSDDGRTQIALLDEFEMSIRLYQEREAAEQGRAEESDGAGGEDSATPPAERD